jgi:hypothetical protein
MLAEALDFPTRGDDGARALLIGAGLLFVAGLFQLVGAVVFPLLGGALLCRIAVRGYYVRVYRRTAVDPDADAPAFDDWGDLFTDGLYSLVIFLAYLLPLVVLVVLAVGGGAMSSVDDPSAAVDALRNAAGLALLLALLYFLGMWYVLPAAVSNFAHEGELRAAFRFEEVVDGAVSEDYAVGWVLTVVVQALIWPVAFLLQFLLVGFFIYFFLGVAVRSILGRSFGAARGFEPDTSDGPRSETAGAAGASDSGPGPSSATSGVPGREASPGRPPGSDAGSTTGQRTGGGSPAGLSTGSNSSGRETATEEPSRSDRDERLDSGGRSATGPPSDDGRARTPAEERDLFGIDDTTVEEGTDRSDGGDGGDSGSTNEDPGVEDVGLEDAGAEDAGEEDAGDDGDDEDDPLADEFTP